MDSEGNFTIEALVNNALRSEMEEYTPEPGPNTASSGFNTSQANQPSASETDYSSSSQMVYQNQIIQRRHRKCRCDNCIRRRQRKQKHRERKKERYI